MTTEATETPYPMYAAFGTTTKGYPAHMPVNIVSISNMRYTIPTNYTSGPEFPTLGEAVARAEEIAREPVRDDWAGEGKHPRVFVARRALIEYVNGGKSDMEIDRIEVFV